MIACVIAIFVMLGALMAAGAEVVQWIQSGHHDTLTMHELWAAIDRWSLDLARRMVETHLAPWVWDPFILWGLAWPAWLILGCPAALALWLIHPRPHPRFLRRNLIFRPRQNGQH
jgi:hypothetical protein